jgi:adenosine deaminase
MRPLPTGSELARRLDFLSLPKVLLHEHLDGGLRPLTVIELARESGYGALPTSDPAELAAWFHRGAQRGNLVEYLEGFIHTTSVMQSRQALERVAYEFMQDMAADGVVYVEVRFAPVFHIEKGLTLDEVMEAVIAGLARGGSEFGLPWGLILCAMRHRHDALVMAELGDPLAGPWGGRF